MKSKILIIVFSLVAGIANAQMATKVAWDYPVKPGSEEWNRLKTEQERIDAVQVPEDVLMKLSPEEVVKLCLSFPLFGYYTAFNTPQDGFSVMKNRFNIFAHLLTMKNAGKNLIAAYKDADMTGFKTLSYPNDFWTIKLDYLELILTQKSFLQSLTSQEKVELLTEARKKFSEKTVNDSFSSIQGLQSSTRIMASILDMEGNQDIKRSSKRQSATQFIQTGTLSDVSLIEDVIRITDDYINTIKQVK
jgi:hypothetical protein